MKRIGFLKKPTFFYVRQNMAVVVRKGTEVYAHSSVPTIVADGVVLVRIGGAWFLELFGEKHPLIFDHKHPPYPISYFKS